LPANAISLEKHEKVLNEPLGLVIGRELNNAFSNNSEKSSIMGDYGGT
jgi:hypothetical protein